ncbi:hypothetical protein, partial [Reyranella sp.]|uniref:hypothetical protein n=1 Tax=Reyranella sp. TaxID=1929291 RepID=UPI003F711BAC
MKVNRLNSLESLNLYSLQAKSFEGISAPKLKTLSVHSDTIESFHGVESLSNLEVLRFAVPADTDFSSLTRCPKLRRIEFGINTTYPDLKPVLKDLPHIVFHQSFDEITRAGQIKRRSNQTSIFMPR